MVWQDVALLGPSAFSSVVCGVGFGDSTVGIGLPNSFNLAGKAGSRWGEVDCLHGGLAGIIRGIGPAVYGHNQE